MKKKNFMQHNDRIKKCIPRFIKVHILWWKFCDTKKKKTCTIGGGKLLYNCLSKNNNNNSGNDK